MKLKFQRTGGFANIPFNVELDTADLAGEALDKTQALVQRLLPFNQERPEDKPDACSYELTVENEGQAQSLHTNDAHLTDEMAELFDWLMQQQK